jgi:hypothetical protein
MLVRDGREAAKAASKLSRSSFLTFATAKEIAKRIVRKGYVPHSLHRRKFVAQQYIRDLDHDFKVLLYGSKAFVLRRAVRKNDFRASGSGKFSWPSHPPEGLLDFAWSVRHRLDVPFLSLDIAHSEDGYRLIEFQCLTFGALTLERSTRCWERSNDGWKCLDGSSELELVFAEALVDYIEEKHWNLRGTSSGTSGRSTAGGEGALRPKDAG